MDYKEKIIALLNSQELSKEQKEKLEEIFPELKESEDERTWIINYLSNMELNSSIIAEKENLKKAIAWLEKQGEKPIIEMKTPEESLGIDSDTYNKIVDECIYDEQKPTDKVEPKFKVKYAGREYNVLEVKDIAGVTFYGIEDEPNHIDYVQAENCERVCGYSIKEKGSPYPTKPAVFSEQKPAWSEEDEMIALSIEQVMNCASLLNIVPEKVDKIRTWLKSLKDRVQPKQEWSEEDEQYLLVCKNALAKYQVSDKWDAHIISHWLENKLKSLRPQNTWKPSDEQIKVCKEVYADILSAKGFDLGTINGELNRLEEELKKLKG